MQIIENTKVKEKLYMDKLENGLTVMIIPKKGTIKKYAIWGTHYGSINNDFVVPGEENETKVPDGIAHFLEHKMFEQENGTNSLDTLTAIGANANAYTTNDHTAYLFECTDNFEEAFTELADYIQHPYFTDENVEKEKGIIGQEIMMYDDYPEWTLYINAIKAMYSKNPVRIDIAGTIESISHIDKEVLYKCYNTFYNPSNMALVLCGDFEIEKTMEFVKSKLLPTKAIGEIKRIFEEEPEEINQKQIKAEMEVSIPSFMIGYKVQSEKEEIVKKHIALEILLNMLAGKSSRLYEKIYEEGLLQAPLDLEFEFAENYAHILIGGQSKEPEKVQERLNIEIKKLKNDGVNEADFERTKKTIYGQYVKEYNEVGDIARMFLADYFKGINSFEYLENYNQITKEYLEQILKELFVEEKQVISIVSPKGEK